MDAKAKGAGKPFPVAGWGVWVFGFVLTSSLCAAPEPPVSGTFTPEAIVAMARAGRNTEAIEEFEALADKSEQPLTLLRAVAGCYWRERRFEEARALYQKILERRPTLQALAVRSNPQAVAAKSQSDRPRGGAEAVGRGARADGRSVSAPGPRASSGDIALKGPTLTDADYLAAVDAAAAEVVARWGDDSSSGDTVRRTVAGDNVASEAGDRAK